MAILDHMNVIHTSNKGGLQLFDQSQVACIDVPAAHKIDH